MSRKRTWAISSSISFLTSVDTGAHCRGLEGTHYIIITLARGRRRFSRSADRREAGPRRAAVLVRRSSAPAKRREHAGPFPVASMATPLSSPHPPCSRDLLLPDLPH